MAKQPRIKRIRKPLPPPPKAKMEELDSFLENLTDADWDKIKSFNDPQLQAEVAAMLERHRVRKTQLRLYSYYPETGPLRRELYHKHMEFYAAGAIHQERGCLGGNRSGKSHIICYETACHMIGWYPEWWTGRRYDRPVVAWLAGEDAKAIRDSLQLKMLGPPEAFGTGMIPFDNLVGRPTSRAGVAEAVDSFVVKHASGGMSRGTFKCFARGTDIKMADGSLRAVEEIRLGEKVLCADGMARRVIETHAYADAPILELHTASGPVVVTPNHRMFLEDGRDVEAWALEKGDNLAIACPPISGEPQEEWRIKLTAIMIGDGCTRGKTPMFACNEPEIVEEIRACLPNGLYLVPIRSDGRCPSYKISSDQQERYRFNVLKHSLQADGLWGRKSKTKFMPQWVFRLPIEQKKLFLRWLWGCDGTIARREAVYSSASERLARDVRLLLWDVGIPSWVKTHIVRLNGKPFRSYYIGLYGDNRHKFTEIGKLNRESATDMVPAKRKSRGEIRDIVTGKTADVFCVTVAESHELIAEGFRCGNSYDMGRESFQAATVDVVCLDEEPPQPIYVEALTRTMATELGKPNGILMAAFTPLRGLSQVVLMYLPGGKMEEKAA